VAGPRSCPNCGSPIPRAAGSKRRAPARRGGRCPERPYEVSYAALAKRGWPAPREAALADPGHLVLVCRSIFITTPQVRESVVDFELPKDWAAVTPWEPRPESAKAFAVLSYGDLVENLLVMTPLVPEIGTAGAFRLLVVPMGPWLTARREVLRVLGSVIPRLVDLMGAEERENYLVVLLPVLDQGAESYRRRSSISGTGGDCAGPTIRARSGFRRGSRNTPPTSPSSTPGSSTRTSSCRSSPIT
jgi:hypothetical protein